MTRRMFAGWLAVVAAAVVVFVVADRGHTESPPVQPVKVAEIPKTASPKVQHFGMVIGIKPEKIEYYKKLHAETWPGVLKKISAANIRNYNIYLKQVDDKHWYLFSHFEYTGDDFDADMKKIAADPETKRWWKETDPCQIPIEKRKKGEWWATMDRVFYHP